MSRFNLIDLSTLTPPDVVETIDFESIKLDILQDLVTRDPSFSALLESDPAVKLVEAFAYREMMLRQRINDAANANMLATALGSDLDNLAALFGVERMSFTDALGNVTSETDDRLRLRAQLAPDAFSCAGPGNAYIYFAFSADLRVADASAFSPSTGNVVVTIYSTDNAGVASADLISAVAAALNADDVRPLERIAGGAAMMVHVVPRLGPPQGVRPEIVAVLAVVGERAKREIAPQPMVSELGLRPAPQITREQSERQIASRDGTIQQCPHAGKKMDATVRQLGGKCHHIAVEVAGEILLGGRHAEFPENLPDDPAVGAAGKIDVVEPSVDAENSQKRRL